MMIRMSKKYTGEIRMIISLTATHSTLSSKIQQLSSCKSLQVNVFEFVAVSQLFCHEAKIQPASILLSLSVMGLRGREIAQPFERADNIGFYALPNPFRESQSLQGEQRPFIHL